MKTLLIAVIGCFMFFSTAHAVPFVYVVRDGNLVSVIDAATNILVMTCWCVLVLLT